MPFSFPGFSVPLMLAVSHHAVPTAVQVAAIPAVLAGGDVLALAPTGSGKTTAFVLPLLQRWLDSNRKIPRQVHTLILVPTRELAAQVRGVVDEFSKHLPERLKVVTAVGGVSINPQMMALRGGADFIVATPGRLLDLVDHNAVNLKGLQTLVLDEADRMLDLGFSAELGRVLSLLPGIRQNLLFSATFPKAVEAMANKILREPSRIDLTNSTDEMPAIQQRAIRVDMEKRAPLLRHLIAVEGWKRVLVFVASQYAADHVADKLRRNGISAGSFHGGISQGGRSGVLQDFKNSDIQVLVSTDLAGRGLDIVELPVVINYDLPRSAADYIHRIGRTGRAGEGGMAISFVTAEANAKFCVIEKRQNLSIPREEVAGYEPIEIPLREISAPCCGIKGHRKSKKDKLREATATNHQSRQIR